MKSLTTYTDYRVYLHDYYQQKKSQPKPFTYKSWAKELGVKSPSTLLMIISGKRHPSLRLINKLVQQLNFNSIEAQYFKDLVIVQKESNKPSSIPTGVREINKISLLENENFQIISQWYGFGIRELANLIDFQPEPSWIRSRLGWDVSKVDIRKTINNLVDLKLWKRDRWRGYKSGYGIVRTSDDLQSAALNSYHQQVLTLANETLRFIPPKDREISGGCFSIRKQDLQNIKSDIRNFQHQICEKYSVQEGGEEIYQIETCFFPLTKSITCKAMSRS